MMASMRKPTVFISYSHRDEEWKELLVRHLGVILDRATVEVWDDIRIPAGSRWEQELRDAMNQARVAVLLISANYLSSDYVRQVEVPELLNRSQNDGLILLPILVRPCAWKTVQWLAEREVLPGQGRALSGGDPPQIDSDLAHIAEKVHEHLLVAA